MSRISGTIKKLALGGIPFDVSADANMTVILTNWANEAEATSGQHMRKMTRQVSTIESVPIRGDLGDFKILKKFSDSQSDITLSVTLINGQVLKSTGWINFENFETDSMTANVSIFPRSEWTTIT